MNEPAASPRPFIEVITSDTALRLLNCNVLFFVVVATLLRFTRFPSETTTETVTQDDGTSVVQVISTPVKFWFVITTIFVLPALIVLFVFAEFVKGSVQKYFNFLLSPIGKGIYLLMIALMIVEVQKTAEIIFSMIIFVMATVEIVVGIIRLTRDPQAPGTMLHSNSEAYEKSVERPKLNRPI